LGARVSSGVDGKLCFSITHHLHPLFRSFLSLDLFCSSEVSSTFCLGSQFFAALDFRLSS
jgi:hypothetical protein